MGILEVVRLSRIRALTNERTALGEKKAAIALRQGEPPCDISLLLRRCGTSRSRLASAAPRRRASAQFVPVTDAMLKNPAPGDWLMWRRTLNGWGYSPLEQIDKSNVAKLEQVWAHPLGMGNPGVDAARLRRRHVRAERRRLRAGVRRRSAATLLWEYNAGIPEGVRGGTNRNLAIWGTTLIDAGADNSDVRDRRAHGQARLGDAGARSDAAGARELGPDHRERQGHHGPAVPAAARRTSRASSRRTMRRRARSSGARARFRARASPATRRWGDVPMEQRWHVGTWMVPSYDAELDRIYIGTSVTIPAPKFILGGIDKQHLYHNSTLALNPADGKIVWYYQHLNDHWDLDHPFERLLVDTAVAPDASEVAWINPRAAARRAAPRHDGHSGQDRHRLHARSRDGRVPLGAADGVPERRQEHRRRDGQGRGRSRARVHARRATRSWCAPARTAARTGRPARTARARTRCTCRCRTCA